MRQLPWIRLLGYAIGVANIQTCVKNGTTYFTSRYFTLNAESHSPTPSAVISASRTNIGRNNMRCVGYTPYDTHRISRTMNASVKSTMPEHTVPIGIASRGK